MIDFRAHYDGNAFFIILFINYVFNGFFFCCKILIEKLHINTLNQTFKKMKIMLKSKIPIF